MRRPVLRLLVAVSLVLACPGCAERGAPSEGRPTSFDTARSLVLGLDDVKAGAIVATDGPIQTSELASLLGYPSDSGAFAKFGFSNGYSRLLKWNASSETPRALATTAFVFADATGGHSVLSVLSARLVAAKFPSLSLGGRIGDESAGFSEDEDADGTNGPQATITNTVIAFRYANAVSLVAYQGGPGEDDPFAVMALARQQLALQKAVVPLGVAVETAPKVTHMQGDRHFFASDLVLLTNDLPAGMRLTSEGPLSASDFDRQLGTTLSDHGFYSAYRRSFGTKGLFGREATSVISATALFRDDAMAREAFSQFMDAGSASGARFLGQAGVGDASMALRLDDYSADATYVDVFFQHRNAVSYIEIRFAVGAVDRSLALRLAQRQLSYQLADLELAKPFK